MTHSAPHPAVRPALGPGSAAGPGIVSVDGRRFPLRSATLKARAEGGLAATTLLQSFANPHAEPLEVVYTMPLPADGAVLGYTMRVGSRTVTGHIERAGAAREQYARALEEGRTAGLLEQERADVFTQQLGCVPPGVSVDVEIEVLHPLAFVPAVPVGEGEVARRAEGADTTEVGRPGGTEPHGTEDPAAPRWEYRFPTVVGVRYQGAPGRVADREQLDPDRAESGQIPARFDLDLLVAADPNTAGPTAPRSPSHAVTVEPQPDGGARVRLAGPAPLDRDLVVRWRAGAETVGASLVEGRGLPGDDGRYAVLTLTPPAAPQAVLARDLTLLIDASGSMTGAPLSHARAVAESLVRSLGPRDAVEVLAFAGSVRALTDGPVRAEDPAAIETLARELRKLEAGGATEMTSALLRALAPLRPDSQRQVVLLTDGYVGFEHEVVAGVLGKLPAGARLHTVGCSAAPNRSLTRAAARAGRGCEVIVCRDADVASAAQVLIRATAAPVLTEVAIRGSAVVDSAPERPADAFAGKPLVVALELRPEGGAVEIEGRLAGQAEPWRLALGVEAAAGSHDAAATSTLPLGALFGRDRVEDVEMTLAAARSELHREELDEEVEALGLRHRIVTRRTSLIAVSEDPTVDPSDPRRRERLAVELPFGVSAEGVGLRPSHWVGGVSPAMNKCIAELRSPSYELHTRDLRIHPSRRASDDGPITRARIVRTEPGLLVIEFEAPEPGIDVPDETIPIVIRWRSGEPSTGRVDPDHSTRPGWTRPGLIVRLGIRYTPSDAKTSRAATVTWETPSGSWQVRL